MSRIDRLGGYKNAKEAYEFLNSSRWHRTPEPDIEALGAELLEYRRANGVFEVGDKVLFSGSPLIHEIRKFSKDSEDVYILGWGWTEIKNLNHATDEEIAAGYRGAK